MYCTINESAFAVLQFVHLQNNNSIVAVWAKNFTLGDLLNLSVIKGNLLYKFWANEAILMMWSHLMKEIIHFWPKKYQATIFC